MASHRLSEITITLIKSYIQSNIGPLLIEVGSDRADGKVTVEPPRSYFVYPKFKGLQLPAVFVLDGPVNFRKKELGPNFISAEVKVHVGVVVEDRDREKLTYKCWRYQAALHKLLDQTILTSADSKTKLIVVVTDITPSTMYTDSTDEDSSQAAFRKEISFECAVEHYESL